MPSIARLRTKVSRVVLLSQGKGLFCQGLLGLAQGAGQPVQDLLVGLRVNIKIHLCVVLQEAGDEGAGGEVLEGDYLYVRVLVLDLWKVPEDKVSGPCVVSLGLSFIEINSHHLHPVLEHQATVLQVGVGTPDGGNSFHERHLLKKSFINFHFTNFCVTSMAYYSCCHDSSTLF